MLKTEGRGLNGSYNRTSPGPASLRSGGTSPCFEVGRPKYNKIHNKNFTKKSTPVSVPEGKGWAAQCPGLFDFKDRQMTHRGTPSGCPSAVRITTNHEIPQARLCPKSSSDYPHISKERRTGYQRDKSSLRSWDGQGFGPPTPGDDTPKNGGGGRGIHRHVRSFTREGLADGRPDLAPPTHDPSQGPVLQPDRMWAYDEPRRSPRAGFLKTSDPVSFPQMMVFRLAYNVNRQKIYLGFICTTYQYTSLNFGRNIMLRRFLKNLCGVTCAAHGTLSNLR
jgi:hypothetical protein